MKFHRPTDYDAVTSRQRGSQPYHRQAVIYLAVVVLTNWLCGTTVFAQASTAATAVYGRGVHAYFAGNSSQAEQYFTQAIQTGTRDPRPYYFRAMLRLNQGRQFEAENDMRLGASFEARNPGLQHSIGRALQRVQGPNRRTLEKFRRQGRLDRLQQSQQRTQQRYEQLDRRGPEVLRQAVPLPLTQPVQPPQTPATRSAAPQVTTESPLSPPPPVEAPALASPEPLHPAPAQPLPAASATETDDDPFGTPAPVTPTEDDPFGAAPTPAPSTEPAPTPAPVEADPFDTLPSPSPQPESADTDLFGDAVDDAAPAEPAPATEPATPEDDPFAIDSPADELPETDSEDADLFGEAAADEEMEAEESADQPAAEGEEDPFGDSSEAEEEPVEEEPAPATEEDDPFGDDPFGGEAAEEESESAEDDTEMPEDGESDPEPDEDDPFGEFGSLSPRPSAGTLAMAPSRRSAAPATGSPAGQLFFALGRWIGSRGQSPGGIERGGADFPAAGVVQADFELGPADETAEVPATAQLPSEADPFAEEPTADQDPADDVDPFSDF